VWSVKREDVGNLWVGADDVGDCYIIRYLLGKELDLNVKKRNEFNIEYE